MANEYSSGGSAGVNKQATPPGNPSAGSAHFTTQSPKSDTGSSTWGSTSMPAASSGQTNSGSEEIGSSYMDAGPGGTNPLNPTIPSKGLTPSDYKYGDPNFKGPGYSGAGAGAAGSGGSGSAAPQKTPEQIAAEKQAAQDAQDAAAKDELAKHWADAAAVTQSFVDKAQPGDVNIGRVDHIDDAELRDMLQQIVDAQKQQTELQSDYTVQRGVNELNRAVEDAAAQFQTERNQVSADEAQALDNQALYAEARGDRGGIGQAQYNSIQNTAATNRLKVNQAQTKLSTDTARQIADLRAQGDFEKADALLSITQSYLSELKSLEQWALQTNLSVDEFNTAVDEWEAEFNQKAQQFLINTELSTAQVTGAFANGTPTLAAQEQLRQQLASVGQAMMEMGLTPTPAQIEAMGLSKEQYDAYKKKLKGSGGGGSVTAGYDWDRQFRDHNYLMKNNAEYATAHGGSPTVDTGTPGGTDMTAQLNAADAAANAALNGG